uniref:Reverse transcriptase domain-containing protein n=1 Tax=Tanacetum cinerariifolium TaxID=118510 RepID=A0A699L4M9_TANCI|nr:reverse transcriptase domain-containing protein [Tanacetum cinerariifolium]
MVRFEKKGKLAPIVGPFEIIKKVGPVVYKLDFPEELDDVHDTFHVSNLKKCLADPTLQVPLDEIQVDAKLNFVEEPVEILEREQCMVESVVRHIKDRLKAAHDCKKSYADKRRKPLEFSVGDYVLLKVSPWKGPVVYKLDFPEELDDVHDTFHVLNLKKCLADPTLQVPLDEIQVDAKLNFVEEPVEILERE